MRDLPRAARESIIFAFVGTLFYLCERMKRIIARILVLCAAAASLFASCKCNDPVEVEDVACKNLLLLYTAGQNSLSNFLDQNIADIITAAQHGTGYVPVKNSEDVLLVMSHRPKFSGYYNENTSASLLRLYLVKNFKIAGTKSRVDTVMVDTLKIYPKDFIPTKAGGLRTVLQDVDDLFHAEHYGMIFSSHGTGWVPPGYYNDPYSYDNAAKPAYPKLGAATGSVPYVEDNEFPDGPPVRSLGQTKFKENGKTISYEFDIDGFEDEFPIHFDYIYFDACLMGGVEFAYQLRNVCDKVALSPTEVLAEGMNYYECVGQLLEGGKGDIEGTCRSYYEIYSSPGATYNAATITLVDCTAMDDLVSVCRELFEKYRVKMSIIDHEDIQPYFRSYHHWYYDLEDILVKCDITSEEQTRLEAALDKCIIYKQATSTFLPSSGGFTIKTYSGLSMYLPCKGSAYLDEYYKTLDWNEATSLVKDGE